MSKTMTILALSVCVLLGACSLGSSSSNSGPKAADLIAQAKQTCTQLGYVPGTREFVDCTSAQFQQSQQRSYGPLY